DAGDDAARPWTSGIVKRPVDGEVALSTLNLAGDAQADLRHHGGRDKAVCFYPRAHYRAWRSVLPGIAWAPGAFGENLTIAGVDESRVCLGDVLRVGTCFLQISQPRQPCWKLARRWGRPDLVQRVQQTGRTGWYARVLAGGTLEAGAPLELCLRPHPEWTVAAANAVRFAQPPDPAADRALAACEALADGWRETLALRADRSRRDRDSRRSGLSRRPGPG
ncbi:MAG: MOSC domain-containing protein, partial [Myxococcota bacterium]